MKGTVPDISRRERGQTKGAREGMLEVVDDDEGEKSGFGVRLSVRRS